VAGVLTEVDDAVRAWIAELAGVVAVDAGPPRSADHDGAPVALYALGVEPQVELRNDLHHPAPATVWLRYLLCGGSPHTPEVLGVLDAVLARLFDPGSGDRGGLDLELEPSVEPLGTWSALGVPPRPAIVLRVRCRFERASRDVAPVLAPLRVEGGPVHSLRGRLVGPGEIPIVGAEVGLPATGARSRTDGSGAFTLPSVPPGPLSLTVRAKGREFLVAVEAPEQPLVIHCDPTEAPV
jgi:hypothetical protein